MPLAIPTLLFFPLQSLMISSIERLILLHIISYYWNEDRQYKKKRSIEFYNRILCLGESQHTRKKKKYIIIEFLILLAVNIAAYSIWYGFFLVVGVRYTQKKNEAPTSRIALRSWRNMSINRSEYLLKLASVFTIIAIYPHKRSEEIGLPEVCRLYINFSRNKMKTWQLTSSRLKLWIVAFHRPQKKKRYMIKESIKSPKVRSS